MSRYESPHHRTPSPQPSQLPSQLQNLAQPPLSPSPSKAQTAANANRVPHSRLSLGPNVGPGSASGSPQPRNATLGMSGTSIPGSKGSEQLGNGSSNPNNPTDPGRTTPNLNRHTLAGGHLPGPVARHVSSPGLTNIGTLGGGLAGDRLAAARNQAPSSPSLASFGSGAVGEDSSTFGSSRDRTTSARGQTLNTSSGTSNGPSINPGLRSVSSGNISLGSQGTLRPQSEYLMGHNNARLGVGLGGGGIGMGIGGLGAGMLGGFGGGAGHLMASPDINHDSWVSDYEAQLEAMASASMEQNFIDELQAIESWFRVLTENERTATLYSLLQQSTPLQMRFFQNVLRQMSSADPMTALLSPAPGGTTSMQAAQDAVSGRYGLGVVGNGMGGLRSPGLGNGTGQSLRSPSSRAFDVNKGGIPYSPMSGHFLGPESAAAAVMNDLTAQIQRSRNRTSAPGTLTGLAHDIGRFASQLDNVIERGPSPGDDSMSNGGGPRSLALGGSGFGSNDPRPKSTDFAGMIQQDAKGPFERSPRPGEAGVGIGLGLPASELHGGSGGTPGANGNNTLQPPLTAHQAQFPSNLNLNNPLVVPSPRFDTAFSPLLTGNWASIVNTPLMPMFTDNSDIVGAALQAASSNLANMNLSAGNGNNRVVLDDPTKFRRSNPGGPRSASGTGNNSGLYNDDGDMLAPGAAQPGRAQARLMRCLPHGEALLWLRKTPLPGLEQTAL